MQTLSPREARKRVVSIVRPKKCIWEWVTWDVIGCWWLKSLMFVVLREIELLFCNEIQ